MKLNATVRLVNFATARQGALIRGLGCPKVFYVGLYIQIHVAVKCRALAACRTVRTCAGAYSPSPGLLNDWTTGKRNAGLAQSAPPLGNRHPHLQKQHRNHESPPNTGVKEWNAEATRRNQAWTAAEEKSPGPHVPGAPACLRQAPAKPPLQNGRPVLPGCNGHTFCKQRHYPEQSSTHAKQTQIVRNDVVNKFTHLNTATVILL